MGIEDLSFYVFDADFVCPMCCCGLLLSNESMIQVRNLGSSELIIVGVAGCILSYLEVVADYHGAVSYAIISPTYGVHLGIVSLKLVFFLDTDVQLCFILCLAFMGWICV